MGLDNLDKTRGILTEADREYLWADPEERREEYSRSARSQRRNAIRNRTAGGLWDLRILNQYLEKEDRRRIFKRLEAGGITFSRLDLILLDAWTFTAKGFLEQRNKTPDDEEFYEKLLTQVIRRVTHDMGNRGGFEQLDVEVTIDGYDSPVPTNPAERRDLSEYSEERLRTFLHQGDITSEQFAAAILEQNGDDDINKD